MKRILFFFALLLSINTIAAENNFFEKANTFFKNNVRKDLVDYQSIKSQPSDLNNLISIIGQTNIDELEGNEKKAFLINAYNLFVIKNVIDHYPIDSPQSVSGFFESKSFSLGEKKVTLNQLENKIIRKEFKDPRIHFVLVCGAVGCPPITDFAYSPDNLDNELDKQTVAALNNSDFVRMDHENKKVGLSEIFKWYAEDFRLKAINNISFINQYRIVPIAREYKFNYYPYNWSLNSTNYTSEEPILKKQSKSVIQEFTPSILLKKGQWDASIFNNLYTETNGTGDDGEITTKDTRGTFFSSTLRFNYGVHKEGRINAGVIATIRSTRIHEKRTDNPAEVLAFENIDNEARFGLSSIAPAIKFTPFKNIKNLSVQSSFSIPLVNENEGSEDGTKIWLDRNSYFFNNQIFFDKSFYNDLFQVFLELDFAYSIPGSKSGFFDNSLTTPFSVFLSYFPNAKTTFYVQAQHAPIWWINDDESFFPYQDFSQYGFGGKYQLTNNLNIELLFTDFFRGINSGTGETYNLGLRYVFL